jgi:AcrR family transcriptional regulator
MQSADAKHDGIKIQLTRTQMARRNDILSAAVRVINREGYGAASLGRIAKEAGTSKSTVLYHFKSKEAINSALIAAVFEEGAAYIAPYILSARDSRERLGNYLAANLQFIAHHPDSIAAIQQIEKNISHADFESSSAYIEDDAPLKWLTQMLTDGQKANEFGFFDPHVMAISIRLLIDSAPHYLLRHPDIDVEHYIDEIVRLFNKATQVTRKQHEQAIPYLHKSTD